MMPYMAAQTYSLFVKDTPMPISDTIFHEIQVCLRHIFGAVIERYKSYSVNKTTKCEFSGEQNEL